MIVIQDVEIHPCPEHPRTHIEVTIQKMIKFDLCLEDAYDLAEKISLCASTLLKDNKKTAKKKVRLMEDTMQVKDILAFIDDCEIEDMDSICKKIIDEYGLTQFLDVSKKIGISAAEVLESAVHSYDREPVEEIAKTMFCLVGNGINMDEPDCEHMNEADSEHWVDDINSAIQKLNNINKEPVTNPNWMKIAFGGPIQEIKK